MPSASLLGAAVPKRPVKRLVAITMVVMLCFCTICGKVLLDARQAAWDHAAQIARSLAATLVSDISRNVESYDLSLSAVIENLAYPEITTVSPELRQLILFDRSSSAKHLDAIVLIDESGMARLDSRTPYVKPVSRAERSYFQFHKHSIVPQLHISEPIIGRESGTPVVVMSRRLSNPDGSFAGVVAGAIRLSYFQQLFKDAALGINGNITLSHTDGTLLMRWPFDDKMLGLSLKGGELYRRLATARSGQFETAAVTDGVHRLIVYSQVADLPLVIGVGQATDDIYAQWRSYALTIGLIMLVLCVTSISFALYLAREMQRSNLAEATLAALATTDGLTGLSNRRCFDAAIDREWKRATRNRTALTLVMCDADLFKSYNDRYGHHGGDLLLQALGQAMNECIRCPYDVAARYGGDEFAILLPATSAEGGERTAALVRARFAAICEEQNIASGGLSIGIASLVPEPGEGSEALLAAADRALYRAKERGRNRIEVATARPHKPVLVAKYDAA